MRRREVITLLGGRGCVAGRGATAAAAADRRLHQQRSARPDAILLHLLTAAIGTKLPIWDVRYEVGYRG